MVWIKIITKEVCYDNNNNHQTEGEYLINLDDVSSVRRLEYSNATIINYKDAGRDTLQIYDKNGTLIFDKIRSALHNYEGNITEMVSEEINTKD